VALFRSLSQPEPTAPAQSEPTISPPGPPPPTPAPTSPPVTGDPWQRIQAAGTIVVGTSADYPPFEYLTDQFQIDGFDIALMDEITRRLGIRVEYRNLAFDGLGAALQVAQIDAAIAAISITPGREAELDFSSIYFAGEDGIWPVRVQIGPSPPWNRWRATGSASTRHGVRLAAEALAASVRCHRAICMHSDRPGCLRIWNRDGSTSLSSTSTRLRLPL
jgi:hypothetical protein